MKVEVWTQHPKLAVSASIGERLTRYIERQGFLTLRVAVAYATVAGLRQLLGTLPGATAGESWWIIGLDDGYTQPGVLEYLSGQPNMHLRVASHVEAGLRFHSKVYAFGNDAKRPISLAVVGSANMTASALRGNGEAVSVLEAQGTQDRQVLECLWSELWGQGRPLRSNELAEYKLQHEAVAKAQAKLAAHLLASRSKLKRAEVLTSDIAQIDPTLAQTCWIEGGNITLMGKELEFKAEQALFFGLSPSGGESPKTFRFRVSDGQILPMTMNYREKNSMWRLLLDNKIPEVREGLRPRDPGTGKLGRSPYVAVFRKSKPRGIFDLSFLKLGTAEFSRLRAQSARTGTLGHTTAREYGWC
ncbi:Hypothetical protein RMHFA_05631 (plasmid) [Roseomonas mucosa]|nr:Hypothetical protein RMHFA_05631 [Roseomonas mucosa]